MAPKSRRTRARAGANRTRARACLGLWPCDEARAALSPTPLTAYTKPGAGAWLCDEAGQQQQQDLRRIARMPLTRGDGARFRWFSISGANNARK
eukprot:11342943-Alexandrium_andersonii.AAC.1